MMMILIRMIIVFIAIIIVIIVLMIIPLIIIMNMKAITITNHLLVESRDTRKAYFQKKKREKKIIKK